MQLRTMVGSAILLAGIGAVAGYDLYSLKAHDDLVAVTKSAPSQGTSARASRINGDMRETFRSLETMPVAGPPVPSRVIGPAMPATALEKPTPTPTVETPKTRTIMASPSPPVAKNMPTSLLPDTLPVAREASIEGRVMDPRATAALNRIASTPGPWALGAGAPMRASLAETDRVPPIAAPEIAGKNESEMTADELNERELRRARDTTRQAP